MIKIKELLIMPTILLIVVTFFGGIAFAAKVTSVNKEKGHVFVDDGEVYGLIRETGKCFFLPSGEQLVDSIVQEVSASEFVVEKNRKLMVRRKKRKSTEQIYRENAARQKIIQEDYIRKMQERERIKEEKERMQEEEKMQEEERMQDQERKQIRERIKKEDPFR